MTHSFEGSLQAYAAFRTDGYRLLASMLAAAPSAALLEWLRGQPLPAEQLVEFESAWTELRQAAEQTEAEQLADEYQQLFIGVGRGELMPYGSWYLTGFLMEKPLIALRLALSELGIERDSEVKEPEDHIAALCEVMAMLSAEVCADIEQQQRFFDNHLVSWAARFFSDLQQKETSRFYAALGRFGERFVTSERQFLAYAAGQ